MLLLIMYKIIEYLNEEGKSYYAKWFDSLDSIAAAKVTTALLRLERGNTSNIRWFSGIGEYKINWGPGYRIYLAKVDNIILMLFGGGTKRTQGKDIKRAVELFTRYKKSIRKKR